MQGATFGRGTFMRKKIASALVLAALCLPLVVTAAPTPEVRHEAPQAAQVSDVVSGWVKALLELLLPPAPPAPLTGQRDCGGTIDPNGSCQP